MKIKNKFRLAMILLLIVGCFSKKEKEINIANIKGYLKEHLQAEEKAELKNIIRNARIKEFETFVNTHEDILKNYPIIVKVMKTEIEPEDEKMTELMKSRKKLNFNDIIWKVIINKGYDKETKQRILTMKGNARIGGIEKGIVTPLMAIAYYAPEIIAEKVDRFIKEGNVDINEKNENGLTALMFAVASEDENYACAAVKELICVGAKVEEKDKEGLTALMLAAQNGHTGVVEQLLGARAQVEEKTAEGMTALMLAASNGHKEVVEQLLGARAQVEERTALGSTALMLAVSNGHKEVVELLLKAGALIDEKSENGWTALHLAASEGQKEIVELLLTRGAQVEEKDKEGWTALMLAAYFGHTEVVEQLLGAGAQVEERTALGITALKLAEDKGNVEIVDLIKSFGGKAI